MPVEGTPVAPADPPPFGHPTPAALRWASTDLRVLAPHVPESRLALIEASILLDAAADEVESLRAEIERHHADFARWEEMAHKGAVATYLLSDVADCCSPEDDSGPGSTYAEVQVDLATWHTLWSYRTQREVGVPQTEETPQ